MIRHRSLLIAVLVPVLALTAAPLAPALAQSIRVLVDGDVVMFDQPPLVAGGRVLVPLRGVFERLGASVQWNPATNTVAAAGTGQVQLTIGSRQAFVNGQTVTLDVPAMIAGGRTLVPLRFVSEAMGARVDWDAAARAVYIFSAQAGGPIPPPVSQPPISQPPPPPAQPSVVAGIVLRSDIEASRILVERDHQVYTFAVTTGTAVRLVEIGSGRTTAISLSQIPPGSAVQVTSDAAGRAMLIRVTVREVTGTIDALGARAIVLDDGRTFTVATDARIFIDGESASTDDLRQGMPVTLWLNPQTNRVIAAHANRQALAPGRAPRIFSVTARPTSDLQPGDVLTVTMRGAAQAQASFRIDGLTGWIPMAEAAGRPGVYIGSYRVRLGDDAEDAQVIVRLVRGNLISRAAAPTRVTIAGEFTQALAITSPVQDSVVRAGWVLQGRATPGQRIVVRVDYRSTVLFFGTRGMVGEFTTTANASGRWAVTINRDAPVADAELTVTAMAMDSADREVDRTVIVLRQG